MMDSDAMKHLFADRTVGLESVRKRCAGRDEIAGHTHFRQDFKEYGQFCRWAVMDNTASEHLIKTPRTAETFRCGLLVNRSIAKPGDAILFEVFVDDKVVGSCEFSYEGGRVDVDIPLHGALEFTIRTRSLSQNAQVASDWLDPEIVLVDGETIPLTDNVTQPSTLLPDFVYDGEPFATTFWKQNTITKDADHFIREFVSPDGKLKLNVDVQIYPEFNAVEYRPCLENLSSESTGIVENFRSLSWRAKREFMKHLGHGGEYQSVTIRRNYGSKSNYLDFVAQPVTLNVNSCIARTFNNKAEMVADEGRCSADWLPFWGVDMSPSEGLLIGFGWTGAWRADFEIDQELFTMSAGMLKTHFRMEPGEKFIQPSVLVMFRENQSIEDAQNRFRKLLIDKFAPHEPNGEVRVNKSVFGIFGGIKTETHLKYIERLEEYGYPYEIYNIDAGWNGTMENTDVFSGTWGQEVGNWQVNPSHPNGMAAISDAAKKYGKTVSIWFEPERVRRCIDLINQQPDWFVDIGEADLLLNLGNPGALQWLIDLTLKLFKENHIDQLHQDFNFNIIPYWNSLDTPDRIGVAEIKYITGLYAYWDTLLAQTPEITIDHCASGGRRIDIETLRRGYVFWRSDAQCWPDNDIIQNQIQNFYLNEWFPFHTGGMWVEPSRRDEYDYFSCVSNGVSDCTFIYKHTVPDPKEFDYAFHASLQREAHRIRPYFLGNYYQLSHTPENREHWCAYQFHCGEKGMFMIFRRPESPNEDEVFRLREIDPAAEYELEIYGQAEKKILKGATLRHYSITLEPRSFQLCYYKRIS